MRDLAERQIEDGRIVQGRGAGVRSRTVTVNLSESPLGWLRSRGLLDARRFEAGERLRVDYEAALLGPRVTMRWDVGHTRGRKGPAIAPAAVPAQIAAKRRFDAAIAAAGPGLQDVLWRVVCACEGVSEAERTLGWPSRSGKLVLGMALDRVADHYGLL